MVQGGLHTNHPRSVHGGGEAPGGQSSLRKGAGKRSFGAPDLEAWQRRNRGEIAKKDSVFGGFGSRDKYWRRGAAGGYQGVQEPPWHGLGWGPPPGRLGIGWPPLG